MPVWRAAFLGALVCAGLEAVVHAQAGLPATAPTAISPSQLPSANPPVGSLKATQQISWNGTQLQVVATNAGLNAILQEIASKTGLSITGTAPDERIFGTYGPGSLDTVLPQLLDGQSVNMLLVDHTGKQKKELVLTMRTGGVTPPSPQTGQSSAAYPVSNPAQPSFQGSDASRRAQAPPVGAIPGDPGVNGTGAAAQGGQNPAPSAAAPADGSQPVSPNGVKTPQQIFEQLQRLRQSQGASQ